MKYFANRETNTQRNTDKTVFATLPLRAGYTIRGLTYKMSKNETDMEKRHFMENE